MTLLEWVIFIYPLVCCLVVVKRQRVLWIVKGDCGGFEDLEDLVLFLWHLLCSSLMIIMNGIMSSVIWCHAMWLQTSCCLFNSRQSTFDVQCSMFSVCKNVLLNLLFKLLVPLILMLILLIMILILVFFCAFISEYFRACMNVVYHVLCIMYQVKRKKK